MTITDVKLPTMRTTARLFGAREIYVGAGVLMATKSSRAAVGFAALGAYTALLLAD